MSITQQEKQEWIDKLRGGKYKQGVLALCDDWRKHCCLGVLCRVLKIKNITSGVGSGNVGIIEHAYNSIDEVIGPDNARTLMIMNDTEGKTFPEIADWIETNIIPET